MDLWGRVKKDIEKGIKEGIAAMKEGAAAVRAKAGELTDEGRRRYRIFELKLKVQREMTELGGKVYDLGAKLRKNPMLDSKVKAIVARIKKLETQIAKLEGKAAPKKAAAAARRKAPAARKAASAARKKTA